jgi:hypothetical protein
MATQRQVVRAIEIHEDELMEYPNVTSLGTAPARDAEEPGDYELAVYVTRIVPRDELEPDELIPKTLEIPARKGTHKIRTQVIAKGEFEFEEDEFGIESM